MFAYISGNTDVVIPVTSTRYSIKALDLPTVSPWRAWYDDGDVSDSISIMNDFFCLLFHDFGHVWISLFKNNCKRRK